jgi:hypothetical protein
MGVPEGLPSPPEIFGILRCLIGCPVWVPIGAIKKNFLENKISTKLFELSVNYSFPEFGWSQFPLRLDGMLSPL